jgi:hypothetical protein
MNDKPISRQSNIVVQEVEGEVLIYDLKVNQAYCLNQTSALVFQLCDGKNSVAAISDLMSEKLKNLVSEEYVWLALNELKKNNLLENGNQLADYFAGLSRREVVKKIGLSTMIALPFVVSTIAPTAVSAQSCPAVFCETMCCNPGENCKTNATSQGSMICCRPFSDCPGRPDLCCAAGLICVEDAINQRFLCTI